MEALVAHPIGWSRLWHSGKYWLVPGAEVFCQIVCHGRQFGPLGAPSVFQTCFGWVIAGAVRTTGLPWQHTDTCHVSTRISDDLLKIVWEIEDYTLGQRVLSLEELAVLQHFKESHHRDDQDKFIVPLPVKENAPQLGESRTMAVKGS